MQMRQRRLTMQLKKFRAQGPIATIFGAVHTGSWRQEYPAVDYQSCVKCGTCQRYCPADAVTIITNQEECVTFAWDFCKGCGICANECPKKCIEMIPAGGEQ